MTTLPGLFARGRTTICGWVLPLGHPALHRYRSGHAVLSLHTFALRDAIKRRVLFAPRSWQEKLHLVELVLNYLSSEYELSPAVGKFLGERARQIGIPKLQVYAPLALAAAGRAAVYLRDAPRPAEFLRRRECAFKVGLARAA